MVQCTRKKDPVISVIKSDGRGKHDSHFKIKDEEREFVIDHINSLPVVDSHYCRTKTNKKYIEPDLKIEKIYDLYNVNVPTTDVLLLSLCFITMFLIINIGFHSPKSDRCGRCEENIIKVPKKYNF